MAAVRAAMRFRARMAVSKQSRIKVEGLISMPKIFLPAHTSDSADLSRHHVVSALLSCAFCVLASF